MATARERIETALRARSYTFNRSTTSSIFATKTGHAVFIVFNTRTQAYVFATIDGKRVAGADAVGQLITKITAT